MRQDAYFLIGPRNTGANAAAKPQHSGYRVTNQAVLAGRKISGSREPSTRPQRLTIKNWGQAMTALIAVFLVAPLGLGLAMIALRSALDSAFASPV